MNNNILKELKKVKLVSLPYCDETTTSLFIPKVTTIQLKENSYYVIKLNDSLINPSSNSTLVTNWNNNTHPRYKYYKVDVCKIMPNMIKVNGIAYDYDNDTDINEMWEGWLPMKEIEVISKL